MTDGNYVEMATHEMKRFTPSSSPMLRRLELDTESAVAALTDIAEVAREQYYFELIKSIVEEKYGLGNLLEVYQIFGGYVNVTFGIYVESQGERQTWIVRKYRQGKTVDSLTFEHRLLLHAKANGAEYTAAPIYAKDGKSYVVESINFGNEHEDYLFAVFNYIGGSRLYDWMPNWAVDSLQDVTVESAALTMAQFHSATLDFDPQGLRGDNILGTNESLKVNELIADFPRRLKAFREYYRHNGLDNKFTEYMDTYQGRYTEWCIKATIPVADYAAMQQCPCQLDFHAGNFKYWDDGSVSGSFDYDMAMVDSRLFDIALGMHYTLASWGLATSGQMRLARVEQFIRAYNKSCQQIGRIPELTAVEKSYFFEAMLQAPIYVYGWAQSAVYADLTADQYEYLFYCQHFSDSCQWLIDHEAEVRELAARL
ncbi:MAG: phosphotransferase [Coriobacteriia bacterium]|nr:phosphotransferase [Coriobacteriia bacterium]